MSAVCAYLGAGRVSAAREVARALQELSGELTPHHRLHGVAYALLVEVGDGRWGLVRELSQRVEDAVAANEATPCALHAWSLIVCAIAHAYAADLEEARRLVVDANVVARPEGYLTIYSRIGLALAREDLGAVSELLPAEPPPPAARPPWDVYVLPQRLDALTAVRDRKRVEAEAPSLVLPGTYFEPFALRALGVVREDIGLVEQAVARFEAIRLGWHAEQTRALLATLC